MNALQRTDIRNGKALAPGETLIWSGKPSWRRVGRDALHLRGVAAYFAFLFVLDAAQAWRKAIPLGQAVHDSVPLAVITGLALAILAAVAWLIGRTTRYTVTDQRVILHYGIAMPATLAIPMSQITATAVSANPDGTADVAVSLKAGNRMPYLKLWPHARPWHLTHPQPMLRGVPQGGAVAAMLSRALQVAEHKRATPSARQSTEARVPELLSA